MTVSDEMIERLRHFGKLFGYDIKPLFEGAADEIERLRAPTAALEAAWQPIETAPNDEPVLVSAWLNNEPDIERFVDIARRVHGEWVDEHDGDPIWTPTHWRPLPAPPVSRHNRDTATDSGT